MSVYTKEAVDGLKEFIESFNRVSRSQVTLSPNEVGPGTYLLKVYDRLLPFTWSLEPDEISRPHVIKHPGFTLSDCQKALGIYDKYAEDTILEETPCAGDSEEAECNRAGVSLAKHSGVGESASLRSLFDEVDSRWGTKNLQRLENLYRYYFEQETEASQKAVDSIQSTTINGIAGRSEFWEVPNPMCYAVVTDQSLADVWLTPDKRVSVMCGQDEYPTIHLSLPGLVHTARKAGVRNVPTRFLTFCFGHELEHIERDFNLLTPGIMGSGLGYMAYIDELVGEAV